MLSAQGTQIQPLEITEFSGGVVDNYVASKPNTCKRADNLIGNENGMPVTRPGLVVDDPVRSRVLSNSPVNALSILNDQIIQVAGKRLFYNNGVAMNEILGPGGAFAFDLGNNDSAYNVIPWNNHLFFFSKSFAAPVKLYRDGGVWKLRNLGLPKINVSGVTLSATAGADYYRYAFFYKYNYTIDGTLFEEAGAVATAETSMIAAIGSGSHVTIGSIPVFANSASSHYETSSFKIEIYRTQNYGSEYYKIGEINNGVTSFLDATNDALLVSGAVLDLNLASNDQPPPAKAAVIVDDVLLLGGVKEGSQVVKNRIRASNRFQPWSCPEEFYLDLTDDVEVLELAQGRAIALCPTSTWMIQGAYEANGAGGLDKQNLSDTIGILCVNSAVRTNDGLFWWGNDGIYFSNGMKPIKVSKNIPNTYKKLTKVQAQRDRVKGAFDPAKNVIIWSCTDSDVADSNTMSLVLHLGGGISEYMPFTTYSGGHQFPDNFKPTALLYAKNTLYQGDQRGYLMRYSDAEFSDSKVDILVPATEWKETAIIYDLETASLNFGSATARKWVPWVIVEAENASSVSMAIYSNNDNSGEYRPLDPVVYKANVEWGAYDIVWGSEIRWNYSPILKAKRRFPGGGLRCSYKQLRLTNGMIELDRSLNICNATINSALKTATLVDGTKEWPPDIYDYFLEIGGFSYRIKNVVGLVAELEDLDDTLVDGEAEWVIRGIRRREILKLISIVINFSFTSASQDTVKVGQGA